MADVTSPANALVKRIVRLRERRAREREGVMVVEGARELRRAVEAGWRLDLLAICPERYSPDARAAESELRSAAVETLTFGPDAFDKASLREGPDGLLGLVATRRATLEDLAWRPGARYLVLVGLEKPGNVGALLRTAAAAGAEAVFLSGAGTDVGNPNVVRSSMGSVFSLPVLTLSDATLREALRARGVRLVTTSPAGPLPYWDVDLTGSVAVVVGPEHTGLDAAWRAAADVDVHIPMAHAVDSLNAATAGALVMFEAVRQARTGTHAHPSAGRRGVAD
jgi:RNA methyltransferase, TrmH family